MKRKSLLFLFLFLNCSPLVSQTNYDLKVGPDKLTLLFLLKNRFYQPLEEKLNTFLQAAAQDVWYEDFLFRAFDSFDIGDPALDPYLNEWVQLFPASTNAYAARALHRMRVGWEIRGYRYARDVSERQWEGMRNYFKLALEDASAGLKLNPRHLPCYDVFITIGMHSADNTLSRRILDKALEVTPSSLQIRLAYMWSLLPRWGGSREQMLQFANESAAFTNQNPRLKVLYGYVPFDRGWELEAEGKYAQAIELFTQALSYGGRALFHMHRGDCYYNLKQYQTALQEYERGLEVSPQDVDLLRSKGEALLALGEVEAARAVLKTASELDPTDRMVQQQKEEAEDKTVESDAHINKGYDLQQQGRDVEAIREYDLAIKADPNERLAYYNRGIALRNLGRYDEALKDFRRAIERDSRDKSAYNNIGWILMRQEKFSEAVNAYSSCIRLNANDGASYMNRAYCYHKLGKIDYALSDMKRACDLGQKEACAQYERLQQPQ